MNNNINNQSSPSSQNRKGDPRIYLVTGFFFLCIISGGVFLGLYIFLPENNTQLWYPTAGLVLVAIPWAVWFLTYLYRCFSPRHTPCPPCKSIPRSASDEMETSGNAPTNASYNESHLQSNAQQPHDDGGRHVHFGGVVVISEYDNTDDNNYDDDDNSITSSDEQDGHERVERRLEAEHGGRTSLSDRKENSVDHRESEIPLTLSGSS
ncbi:uncharacterized protein LOC8284267 [Ricinus communis]|uniref:uncharacterized protein LOC8284267 n=1 Tax=Ricinus communis TaxID=3988 RepID=UPI00201AD4EE|nr:uncharacterized protein LOC8284267 [Ricinus communis]